VGAADATPRSPHQRVGRRRLVAGVAMRLAIDVSRRDSSAVDCWPAMSDRYRISVAGAAGSAPTPLSSHQAVNSRQSVA